MFSIELEKICLAMWLGVYNRPFATVEFVILATQVSCAQLMSQFVPGDFVGC